MNKKPVERRRTNTEETDKYSLPYGIKFAPHRVMATESRTYNDTYDLKGGALQIYSPIPELNEDFILLNPDEGLTHNKVLKFCRERIRTAKIVSALIPDKAVAEYLRELLMTDVYTLVVLTRPKGGKPLKHILELEEDPVATEEEPKGIKDKVLKKLFEDSEKKKGK